MNLPKTFFVVKNGNSYDLRWFTPKAEIDLCGHATLGTAYVISNYVDVGEDPVTGSAHSNLMPFWWKRLNKSVMIAEQLSERGGTLYCEIADKRVKVSGKAVPYMKGSIII